jgi:hypothetical protein
VYPGISVGSHGNGVQRLSVMGVCVGKKRFQLVKKSRFKYRCIHGFMFISVILGKGARALNQKFLIPPQVLSVHQD